MHEFTHFVGLDVHKDTIVIAVAEAGREPARVLGTIAHDLPTLRRRLRRLGDAEDVMVCYEAGPTGYELVRALKRWGHEAQVVTASKTPRAAGGRKIKTDARDALDLAHFLRSGDLTAIHIPTAETEALRDLVRARDDAKRAEKTAKHHLSKFLLRHGRRYHRPTAWSKLHLKWIGEQRFEHAAQQCVLDDYLARVYEATARVDRLTAKLDELVSESEMAPLVTALQALRGVALITAATLAVELGDMRRFRRARDLMGFLGLVPSEHSSGDHRSRGRITKQGNTHVRRVLVESAWHYRFAPHFNPHIMKRMAPTSLAVQAIAKRAQHRLHHKYRSLARRGKQPQKIVVAVARELAGFIWDIGQQRQLLA